MSPSRLDPPRVAILPTATAGNNQSVLIAKAHMSTLNGKKFFTEKISGAQPSATIPVTTGRLHRGIRSLPATISASHTTASTRRCAGMRRNCEVTPHHGHRVRTSASSRTPGTMKRESGPGGGAVQAGKASIQEHPLCPAQDRPTATATRWEPQGPVCQRQRTRP
jgi:hypothetical protein